MLSFKSITNNDINKVFFIGIGGTSMSGLALITRQHDVEVLGSDINHSSYTDRLESNNVQVFYGHDSKNVPEDCDLVVYSAAIHEDNPEMMAAASMNIPRVERAHYLGLLSQDYSKGIAVAGTHGKTTTSSMVSQLLVMGEKDPTVSIGGKLDIIHGNFAVGNSEFFITEACEYVNSFLYTNHSVGIILNIEEDHLDFFKGGLTEIKDSFRRFGEIIPEDGLMIANGDSETVLDVVSSLKCKIETFGLKDTNNWIAKNITYSKLGKPTFEVYYNGDFYGTYSLAIPGEHNVLNALSAIACAENAGVDYETQSKALKSFTGAKRRFEFKGDVNGIRIFEDYAHHPSELKVTIEACTNYDYNQLWVVFQPHTYSRTYDFFDEFVNAFEKADRVILNEIYAKRETNDWNIYSEMISEAVCSQFGIDAVTINDFEGIIDYLKERVQPDDFILVAGSQTIGNISLPLVDALKEVYN
jgi:UDP-N-acetylmuramate--alanine ligase